MGRIRAALDGVDAWGAKAGIYYLLAAVWRPCRIVLGESRRPRLSDRLGRKRTYMLGAGLMIAGGFAFFELLDTRNPAVIVLGIVLGAIPHSLVYGTQAALIAEQFTPRMRYSGASIGYQLASVIAGGPAPLIAALLFSVYKSGTPVAIYICICALIGFVATVFMTEYSRSEISEEYAHVGQARRSL
ncbi:MAG TPA: MFS transporter [Chthoniobacterales bacterium]|jgi:MFS family permease|nr:MFS transporter [Chthoniobacterales bacterium]